MKQFIQAIIVTVLLLSACETIPNEVIDEQTKDYIVKKITAPENITYSENGTELLTTITIENKTVVENVWFDISTINGVSLITSGNKMLDNGSNGDEKNDDNIFTGKVTLDKNLLSDKFEISYYVEDNIRVKPGNIKKVGTRVFSYISQADNFAPEISNLNMPDEINRGDKFAFSLIVKDSNGPGDIASVYYILKNPSGEIVKNSEGISEFPLYDDGQINHSDDVAGDGTYTTNLLFPSTVAAGNWQFTFYAKDKGGLISNSIIHNVNVK